LKNRYPKKLAVIKKTWEDFVAGIRHGEAVPRGFFDGSDIRDLAKRVKNMADYVLGELSPSADNPYCTIVHGDYKSMNVFLPTSTSAEHEEDEGTGGHGHGQPIIIDFASTRIGLGMSDVAMHITHTLHPDKLGNGGEDAMVDDIGSLHGPYLVQYIHELWGNKGLTRPPIAHEGEMPRENT